MRFTAVQVRALLHLASAPVGDWVFDVPANRRCLHVLMDRKWIVLRHDSLLGSCAMLTELGREIVQEYLVRPDVPAAGDAVDRAAP